MWNAIFEFFISTIKSIWDGVRSAGETVLSSAFDVLAAEFPTLSWGTYQWYFDMVNSFVPVEEWLGFRLTYFTLWAALLSYKAIKSWLPGVSGT